MYENVETERRPRQLNFYFSSPRLTSRASTIEAMYRGGMTLEEIGREYGISRERIRQILAKRGVVGKDGGKSVHVRRLAEERAAKRDEDCLKRWGCSYEQYREIINENRKYKGERRPTYAFQRQALNVKLYYGKDAWKLNLWEWWCIWRDSGKYHLRGRGNGYWMVRSDPSLPFQAGNMLVMRGCDAKKKR